MITLFSRERSSSILCLASALAFTACSIEDETDDDESALRGGAVESMFPHPTGLTFGDGLKLASGVSVANGLTFGTGLSVGAGLSTSAGLSPVAGLMTSEAGQRLVKSIIECALPVTQTITKSDPLHGGARVFKGRFGLAPAWRGGKCDTNCQQIVSACLLARSNEQGETVIVDMRSSHPALGVTPSGPQFTVQEGAFFGNLFAHPPRAHACKGVEGSFGVFEGRTCADGVACAIAGIEDHCKDSCMQADGKTFGPCLVGTRTYSQVITTFLDPTPFSVGCPPGCDACDSGVCTFICNDGESCAGELLDCPMGWDCEVVCDGAGACKSAKVDCTDASECAVTCVGSHACMSTFVDCGVGDCDVECDGPESCKQTKLRVTGLGDATMSCMGPSTGEICGDFGPGSCTKVGC